MVELGFLGAPSILSGAPFANKTKNISTASILSRDSGGEYGFIANNADFIAINAYFRDAGSEIDLFWA